jgi:hypothetical protein
MDAALRSILEGGDRLSGLFEAHERFILNVSPFGYASRTNIDCDRGIHIFKASSFKLDNAYYLVY